MFLSKGRYGLKIIPLGAIPREVLLFLREYLQQSLRKKINVTGPYKIPLKALDFVRKQYSARELIMFLNSRKKYKEKMLGIIDEELFDPDIPLVHGMADPARAISVITITGLFNEREEPDYQSAIFRDRLKKVAKEKIFRLSGLTDCTIKNCVMYPAPDMETLDSKGDELCPRCRQML